MSKSIQVFLTPAAGKKLIAHAIAKRADVQEALKNNKVFVIMGTTDAYVANALLEAIGSPLRTECAKFHRGLVTPPGAKFKQVESSGDLLIDKGVPYFGVDLPSTCRALKEGDIVFKGANAVNLDSHVGAVMIADTTNGGTCVWAAESVVAKRSTLILPVGVEKRVEKPLYELQRLVNAPGASGLRLNAMPGEAFTELDAFKLLFGSDAEIVSAGGVNGGEGGTYFQISGGDLDALQAYVKTIVKEEPVVC